MDDVREPSVSLSEPLTEYDDEVVFWERFFERLAPVSYTHLTLPTN